MARLKAGVLLLNQSSVTASGNSLYVNDQAVGGGAINATTQEIDFGTFETTVQKQVSGLSWVSANSILLVTLGDSQTISGNTHVDAIEACLEEVHLAISDKVAGVGFTINAYAPDGAQGKFLINIIGLG